MIREQQQELTFESTKKKIQGRTKITNRDLEVMRFCLEMRFATIEQIHQQFFNKSHTGEPSNCDRWTKDRLFKLRQLDYLKLQKNFTTGQNLILPTMKSYILVRNLLYFEDLPKPIQYVDFRQFEHDRLLTDCRMHLENTQQITRWISERCLQVRTDLVQAFGSETLADGLCINSAGSAWFIELDLSLKTKDRIKKKVRRYVHLLRSEKAIFPGLESVLFVCGKTSIFNAIEREAKIYGSLFKVQMLNDFFKNHNEVSNAIPSN